MAPLPIGPTSETHGAIFIALVVGSIFYGITLLQIFIYYRSYPKDPLLTKLLVAVVLCLDTLHIVFCTMTMYWYLVKMYGNYPTLDDAHWTMNVQTDFAGLLALITQLFFARRVFLLSKNYLLTLLIATLSCLHFTLGVVFTVEAFSLGHFSRYGKLTWITCLGFASAAIADILIASSMCFYLAKRRTEFSRTNSIITTLMIYSINTGLLTSVLATSCVIAFAISPTSFIWLSFFWVLSKCYVNSLMGMLNSRESVREMGRSEPTFVELSHMPQSPTDSTQSAMRKAGFNMPPAVAVAVETITEKEGWTVEEA
ncbi:hypothetical protein JAAARDRAFT_203682 [Jaapia argillacea MUCL 33604]|uniref:DUF6534 domain-containing protein n=1 Tax=Jaapia argillacea MUCL 33604 TaxID=933084 RepID=A0A067Q6A5_9AGAM|nr:hypothetical protein JAAARDRAFT_203682 [Jaapia argillacea MUCL 33604]